MTCAVSARGARGRRGGDLRLDRQHRGERGRLRGARRAARRGDRPRGQDRHRQARPGADARRARDRAARQLRRGARARARARRSATRSRSSTRSTRSGSRARRPRRSRSLEELGEIDALCIPVGNAGNITAYWKGFQEMGARAADARLPGRGRGAARARRAGRAPGDGRERDPDRQPGALGGGDGRDDRLARRDPRPSPTSEILDAYRFLAAREGVFCEPASAAGGRRAARRTAPTARERDRLRAHRPRAQGPADRARRRRASVVPCEPEIAAVEQAVLG